MARLAEEYQEGWSVLELSNCCGCARAAVLKILKDQGVATRPTEVNTMWLEERHYRRAACRRR